jgi:hypothetical protein
MEMITTLPVTQWHDSSNPTIQQTAITQLEQGSILFFPQLTFDIRPSEQSLLSPAFSTQSKNISFDSNTNSLRGIEADAITHEKILQMMRRFHFAAHDLIAQVLPQYMPHLQIARTSFRPVEIAGRKSSSYKKDDTRLHVDAFPSNPVQGRRILRVFSNINPNNQPRVWHVGEPFAAVAKRFLPHIKNPFMCGHVLKALHITKSLRTKYDHIMLQLHDQMKADMDYQNTVQKTCVEFPANTTWIVQTDSVSHAALSGQYVLEQTFYLPVNAMANEQLSPLRILETFKGRPLI